MYGWQKDSNSDLLESKWNTLTRKLTSMHQIFLHGEQLQLVLPCSHSSFALASFRCRPSSRPCRTPERSSQELPGKLEPAKKPQLSYQTYKKYEDHLMADNIILNTKPRGQALRGWS